MQGNFCFQVSHPVVVDQFVGFDFILRSDGPLALDLHPAVVTGVMAGTFYKKKGDKTLINTQVVGFVNGDLMSWSWVLTCVCRHAFCCAECGAHGVVGWWGVRLWSVDAESIPARLMMMTSVRIRLPLRICNTK